MVLTLLKGKIHNAVVTQADLNYQGSIAIDPSWLRDAGILPFEQVHVFNVSNGHRFVTYAIEGEAGTGMICVNGAAARLAMTGDRVIIVAYAQMDEAEARSFRPKLLIMDSQGRPT